MKKNESKPVSSKETHEFDDEIVQALKEEIENQQSEIDQLKSQLNNNTNDDQINVLLEEMDKLTKENEKYTL